MSMIPAASLRVPNPVRVVVAVLVGGGVMWLLVSQGARCSAGGAAVALRPGQLLAVGGMLFPMFFGAATSSRPALGLQAGDQAIPAMRFRSRVSACRCSASWRWPCAAARAGRAREPAVRPGVHRAHVPDHRSCFSPFRARPTAREMPEHFAARNRCGWPGVATAAFSVAFFGVAFALALRPGLLSRVLGRFLCARPHPAHRYRSAPSVLGGAPAPTAPAAALRREPRCRTAFSRGTRTMDLLAALCFGTWWLRTFASWASDPKRVAGSISGVAYRRSAHDGHLLRAGVRGPGDGPTMPDAVNGAPHPRGVGQRAFLPGGYGHRGGHLPAGCLNGMHGAHLVPLGVISPRFSARIPLPAWAAAFAASARCRWWGSMPSSHFPHRFGRALSMAIASWWS